MSELTVSLAEFLADGAKLVTHDVDRVRLADRAPSEGYLRTEDGEHVIMKAWRWYAAKGWSESCSTLPDELFRLLPPGLPALAPPAAPRDVAEYARVYATEQGAVDAISDACLIHARLTRGGD